MDKTFRKFNKVIRNNALLFGTLLAVIVGAILGFSIKPLNASESTRVLLGYPGELFIRALQLLILPTVLFSLIVGSASLNIKSNGKIALRTLICFILTSAFNSIFGLILVLSIHPGNTSIKASLGNITSNIVERKNTVLDNFLDLGRNIVPNNLITTFFEQPTTIYQLSTTMEGEYEKYLGTRSGSNSLGIISYAITVGIVIAILGEKATALLNVAKAVDEVNMKIVTGLICLTPIGVCSIVCGKILEVENMGTIMAGLALFILTVAIGILTYQLIFMQLLYFLIVRKNPFIFYKGVLPGAITGFVADSSAAALPVTLRCLDENVKVDPRISHFVVPIGVTVNMDGTALFVCIASVFIAQMNGVTLGIGDYVNVCVASVAVSIAAATAPSASLTLLFIILNAINVPTEDIGLLFAIDWFVDRMRTTNNVLGDAYTAAIVEHLSREDLALMDSVNALPVKEMQTNANSQTTVM